MALPSSLVEPVNILQQKHIKNTTSEDFTQNNLQRTPVKLNRVMFKH